jgi:drug/metabolite transporter (DMT)-like permease
MRLREFGMLFALALIWGVSFLFIKIGLTDASPATLVVGRLAFSVLTLVVIVGARPALFSGWWRFWRLGLLLGVLNNVLPFLLISWGETEIASGVTSILNATTPLFTVLLANWWAGGGREPLTLRRGAGVLLGFVGVGVLVGPEALHLIGDKPGYLIGEAAVLVAAALYGVGALLSRGFAGAPPLVPPLTMQCAALLVALPVAVVWDPPTHLPSLPALGAMAELGVLGTALAYLLYFWLIRHVGATRTTLVTYLLPCTALFWGALFLGEVVLPNALAGLLLVLLGTMLTSGIVRWPRRRDMRRQEVVATASAPATEAAPTLTRSS